MKNPNIQKANDTIANLIDLAEQAKGLQKRLEYLSDHVDTADTMLDEVIKEFEEQHKFLTNLSGLEAS